jgi:hypothetical protein
LGQYHSRQQQRFSERTQTACPEGRIRSNYSLPTLPGETVLQVDVFHQLHCLDRLQRLFNNKGFANEIEQIKPFKNATLAVHARHCIDYLRQVLVCQADLTLIPLTAELRFEDAPVRMCRDFQKVEQ